MRCTTTGQSTICTVCEGSNQKKSKGIHPPRRLSRELNLPKSTVWKVLRYTLHKKAYHIQVLHKLEVEHYAARAAMCHDLLHSVDEDNLMNHFLFSDEAIFHICGVVNRNNCKIWAEEQPNEFTE